MTDCPVCNFPIGERVERVTFVGAPAGGIPVHRSCVIGFFKNADEQLAANSCAHPSSAATFAR